MRCYSDLPRLFPRRTQRGRQSMDNSKQHPAQRELDRFLRSIPDRLRELFETVRYEEALKKLEDAKEPSPEWIASQLRSLRVKARTIRAAVSSCG